MPKVSVIIPVYNSEKTLVRCAESLILQTLKDIELIFVNDASTDHSLDMLIEIERQFPDRVFVIDLNENVGPGGARNVGLQYARGDYLGFVDSDDVVDIHMYEKAYNIAVETNSDMVDMAYADEGNDRLFLQTPDELTGNLDDNKRCRLISMGGYLWSRLVKRELFENLWFRENVILEDMEVLMELFLRTKRIATIKDVLYRYTDNPDSASKPKDFLKYHNNIVDAMNAVYNKMNKYKNYQIIQPAVEYSLLNLYKCDAVNILNSEEIAISKERNKYLLALYEIRRQTVKLLPSSNNYVKDRMEQKDYQLIECVDKTFESLLI